jgi:hypothetical protein
MKREVEEEEEEEEEERRHFFATFSLEISPSPFTL